MLPPARELNFRFLAFFRFLEKHCFPNVFSRFWVSGREPKAPLRTLLAASRHLPAPSQRLEVLGGCQDAAGNVLGGCILAPILEPWVHVGSDFGTLGPCWSRFGEPCIHLWYDFGATTTTTTTTFLAVSIVQAHVPLVLAVSVVPGR